MKKLNKKGFTLVELLAVIVVLAIVMGLAVVAITGVLDNARKATFVADAKSFLEGAHSLVNADDMNSMLSDSKAQYKPACNNQINTIYIPLGAIKLQQGGEKSPYGNKYQGKSIETPSSSVPAAGNSYIKVDSSAADDDGCTYTFSIFLTDGIYQIPLTEESELNTSKVTTAKTSTS